MFLGNNRQLSKMSEICGIEIHKDDSKRVGRTKFLDLKVDDSFSWNQQYKIIKGRLKGGLNSFRNLREILPQSQLFLVYQALMESLLRYGNLMWGHLPKRRLIPHCRRYRTGLSTSFNRLL